MEQQQVSIAKAGVVASLPARCSVLAAANPKNGSYNMGKTVAENLNMAKPILSRFDLVFILRDRADKEHDKLVSSSIIDLYRSQNRTKSSASSTTAATASMLTQDSVGQGSFGDPENQRLPLRQRLAWVHDFQKEPLPASLVRDYIAYAREYCKPKLTPEAAIVLKDYFMQLRYVRVLSSRSLLSTTCWFRAHPVPFTWKNDSQRYPPGGRRKRDNVPITTRQLEALIRLCQARAKACLRDYCLREDALDVVELMGMSVEQVHCDESGGIDPGRGGAGSRIDRKLKKAFVSDLHQVVGIGAECGMDDMRRIADRVNCGLSEFASLLEDLRLQGVLLKKSNGRFQVLS
jgi:DNA helicase MCM8